MERFVGILLNDTPYKQLLTPSRMDEPIGQYEEAGTHFGVVPAYLRLQDLKAAKSKTTALVWDGKHYKPSVIPVPKVVYNRAVYTRQPSVDFLATWGSRKKSVFNACNDYSLLDIHYLLSLDPSLSRHLPALWPVSSRVLEGLKKTCSSLDLVQEGTLHGSEQLQLNLTANRGWEMSSSRHEQKSILTTDMILSLQTEKYLIRPTLSLMKSNKLPLTIQVCSQRDETGKWKITGLTAMPELEEDQDKEADEGVQSPKNLGISEEDALLSGIRNLSMQIAEHLSQFLPSLAEVGLEFGITEEGLPLFLRWVPKIRKVFYSLGLTKEWTAICHAPIGYAHYLLHRQDEMFTEKQHAPSP